MNLIDLAAESLIEYDLLPRPLTPLEEQQALVCERSKHLSFSSICDACDVPLDPGDKLVFGIFVPCVLLVSTSLTCLFQSIPKSGLWVHGLFAGLYTE